MINDRLVAIIAIGICELARAGISDSFEEIPRALLPRKQNPASPLSILGPSHVLIDYRSRMKNRLGDRSGFNSRGEWGRKRAPVSSVFPQSRPFGRRDARSRGSQTCARFCTDSVFTGRRIKAITEVHEVSVARKELRRRSEAAEFNVCYVGARQLFRENYARARVTVHRDNLVARVAILREKKFDRVYPRARKRARACRLAHARARVRLTLCRRGALCRGTIADRESILFRSEKSSV